MQTVLNNAINDQIIDQKRLKVEKDVDTSDCLVEPYSQNIVGARMTNPDDIIYNKKVIFDIWFLNDIVAWFLKLLIRMLYNLFLTFLIASIWR